MTLSEPQSFSKLKILTRRPSRGGWLAEELRFTVRHTQIPAESFTIFPPVRAAGSAVCSECRGGVSFQCLGEYCAHQSRHGCSNKSDLCNQNNKYQLHNKTPKRSSTKTENSNIYISVMVMWSKLSFQPHHWFPSWLFFHRTYHLLKKTKKL